MARGRRFDFLDQAVFALDTGLRTLLNNPAITGRENPAGQVDEVDLSASEQKHIAGLMRINHCGEVCAQGLYTGQALTANSSEIREKMQESADEENDHLAWTAGRIEDMQSHLSVFNPIFYLGSVAIGAAAGLAGDKWSLGFVAETERQVVKHLDGHLAEIKDKDPKSSAILEKMREDELHHAIKAVDSGAAELPRAIKKLMTLTSKVMTKTTYWV